MKIWINTTLVILACVTGAPRSAGAQLSCAAWLRSMGDYERGVEAIVEGEPEDLLDSLRQAVESSRHGDKSKAETLEAIARGKVDALVEVGAPQELDVLHHRLIRYHAAVIDAAGAVATAGAGGRSPYIRSSCEALLGYYEELLRLLLDHDCDAGDIDALENNIIPGLRQTLKVGFSEDESDIPAKFAPYLELLRQHDQSTLASGEVYEAAKIVIWNIDFEGRSRGTILRLLGEPLSRDEDRWFYSYHTGYIGVQCRLHFDPEGRVQRVELIPTQ